MPEEPHEQYERQKDRSLKDELHGSIGAQYATGEQWRNNSRKNEETEPKLKEHPVVVVTGDGNKVQSSKEQYCVGTWNVMSMSQGKLEVVKQEMARANINILGISELKWTGIQFSSVQLLRSVQLFVIHGLQHARPPCPSPTPGVYSNSCSLYW